MSNVINAAKVANRIWLRLCLISILSLFSAVGLMAQDHPMATIDEQGMIHLPEGEAVVSKYLIDLSGIEFSSSEEMVEFMSTRSGDSYMLRAFPGDNKAILMLDCSSKANWNCANWNAHFSQECLAKPIKK